MPAAPLLTSPAVEHRVDRRGAIDRLPDLRLPLVTCCALLLLRTVVLFAGDGVIAVVARTIGADVAAASLTINVVIVGVDVLTLVVLARLLRRRGGRLRDVFGPIRIGRDLLLAVPLTLLLAVGFVAATFVANLIVFGGPPPAEPAAPIPLWLAVWSITVMPATVAVAEEALYRGVGLHALATRLPAVVAVLVTSVFFGLQHAALSLGSPADMLARVLTTFLVGLLFAALALRLRRLLPLIVGHWALDVVGLGLPMLIVALR